MAILLVLFWNLAWACFWFSVAAAGVKRTQNWWEHRALENQEAQRSGQNSGKNEMDAVEFEKVNQESGTKILKKKVKKSLNSLNVPKTPDTSEDKGSSRKRKTAQDQLPSLKS